MNKILEKNKWMLNTELHELTVNERKDAIVLLYFLNTYGDQIEAFKELKSSWVNNIYKLPKTSSSEYNSVKNGRYNILSRMRLLQEKYIIKQPL
jgi:hypothetical protein